jgi:hypothetical protein
VARLAAVIDLGPALVDVPERIAAVAEAARPGNGASVLEYVRDLDRAFVIPILSVTEYPGVPVAELRSELVAFHPPQGYVRLAQHRPLLGVREKMTSYAPVHHRRVHPRD